MIGGRTLLYQGVPMHPLDLFRAMEEEMGRFFGEGFAEISSGYPSRNVWYNENGAYVVAELPGVTPDNLEATVVGRDTIVIKGARNAPERSESEKTVREGRSFGTFMRSISLPFEIEPDGMSASLRDGLLVLFLPRKEEEKPKRIDIKMN